MFSQVSNFSEFNVLHVTFNCFKELYGLSNEQASFLLRIFGMFGYFIGVIYVFLYLLRGFLT